MCFTPIFEATVMSRFSVGAILEIAGGRIKNTLSIPRSALENVVGS
jgi:hypothetical protein